jgi:hypothetical protein
LLPKLSPPPPSPVGRLPLACLDGLRLSAPLLLDVSTATTSSSPTTAASAGSSRRRPLDDGLSLRRHPLLLPVATSTPALPHVQAPLPRRRSSFGTGGPRRAPDLGPAPARRPPLPLWCWSRWGPGLGCRRPAASRLHLSSSSPWCFPVGRLFPSRASCLLRPPACCASCCVRLGSPASFPSVYSQSKLRGLAVKSWSWGLVKALHDFGRCRQRLHLSV